MREEEGVAFRKEGGGSRRPTGRVWLAERKRRKVPSADVSTALYLGRRVEPLKGKKKIITTTTKNRIEGARELAVAKVISLAREEKRDV